MFLNDSVAEFTRDQVVLRSKASSGSEVRHDWKGLLFGIQLFFNFGSILGEMMR